MPGNSTSRLAAMICSRSMYVRTPTSTRRGSTGGTLIRANPRSPVSGLRTVTARESDRLLM